MTSVFGLVLGVQPAPLGAVLPDDELPPQAMTSPIAHTNAAPTAIFTFRMHPPAPSSQLPAPSSQPPAPNLRLQPVLRQVIRQRPLADSHQFGGILLHAARVLQ